jgi:recombination protein RecR
MNYPSKLIENAVVEFKKLPGIGEKTALRLVLHLLKQEANKVELFSETMVRLRLEIKECKTCFNLSDNEECEICTNKLRESKVVCVVENIRDIIAIENTGSFRGQYHVLGGVISPINGIGPNELKIAALQDRIAQNHIDEIIMAISPTIEGDTTIFYISKLLKDSNLKITTIARGVSFGGELEYTDELTLARSIDSRIPYQNILLK